MKNRIVVIGSSNIDLIMKIERLPEKGETVTDGKFMQVYGGKGANQAVAAARAGGMVSFISCVGDDANTPRMLENYKADNINIQYVFREKNTASGHALIMVGSDGANCIAVAPGANEKLSPDKIVAAMNVIEEAAIIVMQYEIPEETIKCVIDIARRKDIPVMWNMAPARAFDSSYVSKINILVLNEIEAGFLTNTTVENETDAEHAANILLHKGVEKVIVTLGVKGVVLSSEKVKLSVPAYSVEAIDTTAAGDTFCGSLAVALVEQKTLQEALKFASAAAAISVTQMGAQPSIPTRIQIEALMNGK